MFVKKGDMFLSGVSLKQLEEQYTIETNAKAKIRLQCALLRKKGKSQPFISEVTGKPVTTVSDILRRFEKRGMAGRYAIKQNGQPPKLRPLQRLQLRKALSHSPTEQRLPFVTWTTKLIQYFIERRFGITYVLRQVSNLAASLGFSTQKPRPEHLKANKALQARFKKNFDERLRDLCEQDMRSSFWTRVSSPCCPISQKDGMRSAHDRRENTCTHRT